MRLATELGALPPEISRLIGLQPKVIPAVRHHVHLAGQLRHPEGMDDVDRPEVHPHRRPAGITNSLPVTSVPLPSICSLGIPELEPPLVAGRRHFVGIGPFRFGNVVRVPDGAHRWHGNYDSRAAIERTISPNDKRVAMALFRGRLIR
jgi:hypothetical protein